MLGDVLLRGHSVEFFDHPDDVGSVGEGVLLIEVLVVVDDEPLVVVGTGSVGEVEVSEFLLGGPSHNSDVNTDPIGDRISVKIVPGGVVVGAEGGFSDESVVVEDVEIVTRFEATRLGRVGELVIDDSGIVVTEVVDLVHLDHSFEPGPGGMGDEEVILDELKEERAVGLGEDVLSFFDLVKSDNIEKIPNVGDKIELLGGEEHAGVSASSNSGRISDVHTFPLGIGDVGNLPP